MLQKRLLIWPLLFAVFLASDLEPVLAVMPSFDRASENVTVIIGSAAVLPCFISNLGDHKVAWIKVANTDVLSIGDYKVTNDDRIKLVHGYVTDWSLSIQPINEEDAGEYICQINTEPQMVTRINLEVLLPPKIIEEKSTISPEPVREGDTLALYCHTEGIPKPKVSWFFRKRHSPSSPHHHHSTGSDRSATVAQQGHQHSSSSKTPSTHEHILQEGDTLVIKNVSRYYSGVFECIANNSVPPAASRKIKVSVEFPPELHVHQDKVEQILGQEARMECRIRANPLVNYYWMKDGRVIESGASGLLDSNAPASLVKASLAIANEVSVGTEAASKSAAAKYEIFTYNQNSHEHVTISALIVKNITKNDLGLYQCFAVNAHNISKVDVELKEIQVKRASSTKSAVSRILIYNGEQHQKTSQLEMNGGPKVSSKMGGGLSKQQRKTNSTGKLGRPVDHENSADNDYFEHDLSENTLTLINSVGTSIQDGIVHRLLLSICFFLFKLILY